MGYRASRQASIKCAPYYMLFQQEMRLPIDIEIRPSSDSEDTEDLSEIWRTNDDEDDVNKIVDQVLVTRENVFQAVSDNIKKAQCTQKK